MDASLIAAVVGEPEESQVEREKLARKLAVLESGREVSEHPYPNPFYIK